MTKIFKLLTLLAFFTFATSCGNTADGDDHHKECCEKNDKGECSDDCTAECCEGKEKHHEAAPDSSATDSLTEGLEGGEQAHVCTEACETDPHSCPNHKH